MENNSLKSNISYTTIGMVLYNIAIWFLSALVLRLLGATMSGYYAVALSIANPLYAVAMWGLRGFIVSDTKNEFDYVDYCYTRLITIGISFFLMILFLMISQYSMEQTIIICLYTIFKFTETMIELMDCFCQKQMKMDINAKSMIIRGILFILLFYLFLLFTHSLIVGLLLIIIVTVFVFAFYNYRMVSKQISFDFHFDKNRILTIIVKCFPIMLFEMLSTVIVAIPRLVFERMGNIDTLGVYVSVYSLVVFLQLVVNALIMSLAPYMAKAYNENKKDLFKKYVFGLFGGAIGLGILAEVCVLLLGKFVIGVLYGNNNAEAYTYLYWGIVSGVFLTFTWMFSQIFIILKKNNAQLICAIVATFACAIFSYLFVDPYAVDSVSIVMMLSNLVYVLCASGIILFDKKRQKRIDMVK